MGFGLLLEESGCVAARSLPGFSREKAISARLRARPRICFDKTFPRFSKKILSLHDRYYGEQGQGNPGDDHRFVPGFEGFELGFVRLALEARFGAF